MLKKNILVTGSEGIIGKSLVQHLERLNSKVFKIDVKKNVKNKNYFKCDITKENQVKKCISNITKKNNIDILINNASFAPKFSNKKFYKFSDYKLADWKNNLEVDLIGSFLVSKYVCKNFEKRNSGTIINISSIYGMVGPDQEIYKKGQNKFYGYKPLEYSVAKAGIIGFTRALASFYKKTNIRVICLIFGGIKTNDMGEKFINNYRSKTISNRMANKSEYNDFISFYASDKARYANGSCIVVDGGATSIL